MQHYSHLDITRLNIFTDGCAEQYKSRRNALFIAELAKDYTITVTHNFAPTASFKTMVDGQGDLVKSTYMSLENNEVEGTRCPTTYELFELFTSSHQLIPPPISDANRRLMSITGRMHRLLIDKTDVTEEMKQRALTKKDIIITDYLNERWDATAVRGIKGVFNLIGKGETGELKLYSREHACFCDTCMTGNFEGCVYHLTTGILKSESITKLPYKDAVVRKVPAVGDELRKINYFKDVFSADNAEKAIVAIITEDRRENEEAFKLGMVTKRAKQLGKDYIFEYSIDGSTNKITIVKGVWCITVRFMEIAHPTNLEYIIPTKAK